MCVCVIVCVFVCMIACVCVCACRERDSTCIHVQCHELYILYTCRSFSLNVNTGQCNLKLYLCMSVTRFVVYLSGNQEQSNRIRYIHLDLGPSFIDLKFFLQIFMTVDPAWHITYIHSYCKYIIIIYKE